MSTSKRDNHKTITAGVLQRNSIEYTFCNKIALVNRAFTETCRRNGENIFLFKKSEYGGLFLFQDDESLKNNHKCFAKTQFFSGSGTFGKQQTREKHSKDEQKTLPHEYKIKVMMMMMK